MEEVLNNPSKPQTIGAATGRTQASRRHIDTFFDQHRHPTARGGKFVRGRPWCGPREISANKDLMHEDGFCGALSRGEYVEDEAGIVDRRATFATVWQAPWQPFEKYFKFNYKRKTIQFLYAEMRQDERAGLQRYYQAASKLGIQLNIRVEPNVMPHPQIVYELGEPSRLIKIAEAALAGDPWLLGFIDEPNPLLAEILGVDPQSGIVVNEYASYTPPEQIEKVEAIVQAPPNADLMALLSAMKSQMDQQQALLDELTSKKKAAADKMEKVRAARTTQPRSSPEEVPS